MLEEEFEIGKKLTSTSQINMQPNHSNYQLHVKYAGITIAGIIYMLTMDHIYMCF